MTTDVAKTHLTIRISAGFNAEVMLAGLLAITAQTAGTANATLATLFPNVQATLDYGPASVNAIMGVRAKLITAPLPSSAELQASNATDHKEHHASHAHRSYRDILAYYDREARLSEGALDRVERIWGVLAAAEAKVHGTKAEAVHFHEVGRLSNVLAIGLIARFIERLNVSLSASPVPVADGAIRCAHGLVANPAPAMMAMLPGVPVVPFLGVGEPVTPTGMAILLGLGATFGPWPRMRVTAEALAYARTTFTGVPNGTRFVLGELS